MASPSFKTKMVLGKRRLKKKVRFARKENRRIRNKDRRQDDEVRSAKKRSEMIWRSARAECGQTLMNLKLRTIPRIRFRGCSRGQKSRQKSLRRISRFKLCA